MFSKFAKLIISILASKLLESIYQYAGKIWAILSTVFGKNSTPDVVFRTLVASNGLNVNIEYVDDISTANSYLMSGKAEIIVSAEPVKPALAELLVIVIETVGLQFASTAYAVIVVVLLPISVLPLYVIHFIVIVLLLYLLPS